MVLSPINWKKTKYNYYFEIYPYHPQHPHPEQLFLQGIACSASVSLPVSCFLAWPDSLGPWRSLHCHSWLAHSHSHISLTPLQRTALGIRWSMAALGEQASVTLPFHLHSTQVRVYSHVLERMLWVNTSVSSSKVSVILHLPQKPDQCPPQQNNNKGIISCFKI